MAIRATATVTFIGLKQGLLTGKAPDHVGTLYYAGLGVKDAFDALLAPAARRLAYALEAPALLPLRPLSGHKGTFGKVGRDAALFSLQMGRR
jgi:NAD(P)H-hydrate epimerase